MIGGNSLKKVIALFLMGMIFCLVACGGKDTTTTTNTTEESESLMDTWHEETEKESETLTQISESSEFEEESVQPTDTKTVSAILGSLTKEDGTGEVAIHSNQKDLKSRLDTPGISYSQVNNSIECSDGTMYLGYSDGMTGVKIRQIKLMQTSRGLKIGDPVSKMKEIYGDAELQTGPIGPHYIYNFPNEDNNEFKVIADGITDSAKITYLSVSEDPSWGIETDAGE